MKEVILIRALNATLMLCFELTIYSQEIAATRYKAHEQTSFVGTFSLPAEV